MVQQHQVSGRRPPHRRSSWPWLILAAVALVLVLNHFFQWYPWPWTEKPPAPAATAPVTPPPAPSPQEPKVIDYKKVEEKTDPKLTETITDRKQEFGLTDSVDMVVQADEAIKVGEETVTVKDILAQIEAQTQNPEDLPTLPTGESKPPEAGEGTIREETLTASSETASPPSGTEGVQPGASSPHRGQAAPAGGQKTRKSISFYGVHVVRSGDNLWDIHFAVLREYLKYKGIEVPEHADEAKDGRSTGVARILKYAESMVHIYNLKTKRLDRNLDLLEPHEKVVVFNLTRLNLILGSIKPGDLDKIQYDGRELYWPDKKPAEAGN
jgi:hypothetical protein